MLSNGHAVDLNVPDLMRSSSDERSPNTEPPSQPWALEDGMPRRCEQVRSHLPLSMGDFIPRSTTLPYLCGKAISFVKVNDNLCNYEEIDAFQV